MLITLPHPSLFVSFGLGTLVVWRLYARVRRMIGRQELSRTRLWATALVFPLIVSFLLLASLSHPINLVSLLCGIAAGSALGVYGIRLTTFENTPQGLFYTPSLHLGIALSLLFIGRVIYGLAQFYLAVESLAPSTNGFVRSPATLAIFGTLAGYYVAYAVGLIRWSRRAGAAPRADSSTGTMV